MSAAGKVREVLGAAMTLNEAIVTILNNPPNPQASAIAQSVGDRVMTRGTEGLRDAVEGLLDVTSRWRGKGSSEVRKTLKLWLLEHPRDEEG